MSDPIPKPVESPGPPKRETPSTSETSEGAPSSAQAPVPADDEPLARLLRWLPMSLAIAAGPGLCVWAFVNPRFASFVFRNNLGPPQRASLMTMMMLSTLLIAAVYLLVWRRRRRQRNEINLSFAEVATDLNRDLLLLLALPFVGALQAIKIESEHPNLTLLYAATAAVICLLGSYHLSRHGATLKTALSRFGKPSRWLPLTLVTTIYLSYSAALSRFALIDHRNIWTQIFDLGIYDNLLWRTLHGDFLGSSVIPFGKHWAAHFDPILGLLVPIYALAPDAETLLITQSFWLGTGVFPIYLMAKHHLGSPFAGVLLALLYALHPALHGVNMFDFHSLSLAIPLMMWAVYFVARKSPLLWPALLLLLACREDMALLACFIGAYAMLERRPRTGLAIIGISLSYLAFVKLVIMPDSGLMMSGDRVYSYAKFYSEMIPRPEEGVRGLVLNLISNPVHALQMLCKEAKLRFFVQLLLPLLFVPLFAGRARMLWLYGLVFIGLASRPNMFALNFQYSSVLFPMLFIATPEALARLGKSKHLRALGVAPSRLRPALLMSMLVASSLTSWKFGVFVPNNAFLAGWQPLTRSPGKRLRLRSDHVREMVAAIPADAAVSASSEIGSQLSNREKLYRWPDLRDAEYLLLGVWRFGKGEKQRVKTLKRRRFELIDSFDGVELLRRRPPPLLPKMPR